jgi:hypothetical protein
VNRVKVEDVAALGAVEFAVVSDAFKITSENGRIADELGNSFTTGRS